MTLVLGAILKLEFPKRIKSMVSSVFVGCGGGVGRLSLPEHWVVEHFTSCMNIAFGNIRLLFMNELLVCYLRPEFMQVQFLDQQEL